ncbi:hypothetical protein TNCV_2577831 [Trichonephila clavipes]|nr:hypothetical protein TNCV_2577831 [Trichonephila clavipes]
MRGNNDANTSGYNLRPRGGSKEKKKSPDQTKRRGHNKEDQFDPEEAERNNRTTPTPWSKEGQVAGIPEAEEVSNNITRRVQEERDQSKIPLP